MISPLVGNSSNCQIDDEIKMNISHSSSLIVDSFPPPLIWANIAILIGCLYLFTVAQFILLGWDKLRLGNHAAAIHKCSWAIRLFPWSRRARLYRGIALYHTGQYHAAVDDLNFVIRRRPNDVDALIHRGAALSGCGDLDAALADFKRALDITPRLARAFMIRGIAYAQHGQFDRAVQDLTFVIEHNPDYQEAYYHRATSRFRLEQYQPAIEDLTKLLKLNPDYPHAFYMRAGCYLELSQYELAREDLESSLRSNPHCTFTLTLRGLLNFNVDEWIKAETDLIRTLELNPSDHFARLILGLTRQETGNHSAARADFLDYLEVDSSNSGINARDQWLHPYDCFLALSALGRDAEALAVINQALLEFPDQKYLLNCKAWLLSTSPDNSVRDGLAAIQLAQRACELSRLTNSEFIATLSAAYAETGDFPNALLHLDQADSIAPLHPRERSLMRAAFQTNTPYRTTPLPAAPQ